MGNEKYDNLKSWIKRGNYVASFETEVLVASVRSKQHLIDAAIIGAHVATLPPKVVYELYEHPLTDKGLKAFLDDWAKTGQSILPK